MRIHVFCLALGIHCFAWSQTMVLPKFMGKNWISIPALEFNIPEMQGNDSMNFMQKNEKISTQSFYVLNKEISNLDYRNFVNHIKDETMLPDTNSWNTDFIMAYNGPMARNYYWHPKYYEYPVVGVSQIQALAYCRWLQDKYNALLAQSKIEDYICMVNLPTESQWQAVFYSSYLIDEMPNINFTCLLENKLLKTKGKYNLNFGIDITKEGMGIYDYMKDGGMYPVAFTMYNPSKNGLYNLMGNVAEWTISPAFNFTDSSKMYYKPDTKQVIKWHRINGKVVYDTSKSYIYYNNPAYLKPVYEKDGYFAVKGGSWCHSTFYIQPKVSVYCQPNEQHSYIGFRPVMTLVKKKV